MMRILLLGMLCFLMIPSLLRAQEKAISGKVTAADDESAIPGVSILVLGTNIGTTTGMDGFYKIQVPVNAKLIFSFVGMVTKEVSIANQTIIDVKLVSDIQSLAEVVVTGSGVATSKARLGIAVESVSAKDLPQAPTASIDQALIGKIPGAQISTTSGNPGDPVNIVLRGINSVQGGTKPLIMLDGIQLGATDMNSLDLSNVERVEVVQGAAASALYGAQGANGVIQIFSKKGKKGPVSINYSASYSQNTFINSGNVNKANLHSWLTDASNNIVDVNGKILEYSEVDAITGIAYENPWLSPSGGTLGARNTRWAVLSPENISDKPYNANLKFYDHFKQIFKTGNTWNHNLSVSGGGDKSDYSLSLSHSDALTPIMNNGHYKRTNLSANIGTELFKNFKIRSTTQLVYTTNNIDAGLGGGGGTDFGLGDRPGDTGLVWSFLNTSPFFDLYKTYDDGTPIGQQRAGIVSVNAWNPYYDAYYKSSDDQKVDVIQNFNANYMVNKFLTLDASYGINYKNQSVRQTTLNQTENINTSFYSAASDLAGDIYNYQYKNSFQNFLGSAFIYTDFKKDFGWNIPIETSTQVSFDYRKKLYAEYNTYGYALPLVPPINMSSTSEQSVLRDYEQKFVTYGYLVNQKINFGDYAGVTVGFRSDWSSAFGGGSKPATFPHYDGFFAPSAFNFWRGIEPILPYFKLRAAYGEAGIQPGAFDRYPVLSQGNLGDQIYYANPSTVNNPNLKVEISKELELGTDLTLVLNKNSNWLKEVNFSFTYWKRSSEDVIYSVSQPISTGTVRSLTNAIEMSSHGIQFSLNLPVIRTKDLRWDFTANFGKQTSKVDAIAGGADIILTSSAGSSALTLSAGQKIGQIFGYKALTSVNQLKADGTRFIQEADVNNYDIVDGRVVNINTKAIQWESTATSFGDPNPKFNSSFINNLRYKGLSLGFQFDWVYKSHLYNQVREWMYRDAIHKDFATPVTIGGQTAAYTAYYMSAYAGAGAGASNSRNGGGNATKDYYYEDASFVRLRNVSLGFDVTRFVKLKYFKKIELILTGRNILTFTKYTGFDPEISSATTANSSFDRGVDNGTMPNTKSYQAGLNLSF
ncbi:SusC/RagA family TonB-linked outer membrane protein [Dyadobacter psychrotolerans]|uniref:SusC/RagA family TonB-linked outer membrane protein n=1 Tax=Dyadobacter psychrotolerans TaxID=2541721 RepID=A0A4R5DFP2_9BACT|nr:SusC/RagA family TonB-linked outer membrane protein [Dyadobacter psychrotolerans]TDE11997.1 SusC/RagA family TonB-linked outer membrane protein [Dyadobacter psychrotolerans]